jgi:predicted unusual protein kinase regulating ubiquinone biosynthesis (AarF/ABC1/UbiB family)
MSLEALGGRYSCLALYLSTRIDLLPAEYCRELALVPDVAPPLSPPEVQRLLAEELGEVFGRSFADFDFHAQKSNLVRQSHVATLRTGELVTVSLLHPEFHRLQDDAGLRDFLDSKILGHLFGDIETQDSLTDFLFALRRRTNLSLEREALESTDRYSNRLAPDWLHKRKVYRELSTARLITIEKTALKCVDQTLAGHSRKAMASHICHVWLAQALAGDPFSVDPQAHHLAVGENGSVSFEGCEFAVLPKQVRDNLWNYLLAALVDDPDRSAAHLLREMYPETRKEIDPQSFRTSFRQSSYFAALEPILGTDSNAFVQLVFQHWKTALDHGYRPKPLLLCFFRGLFSVARIARRISPGGDAMREGMEELRSSKIFNAVSELIDLRYLAQNADKFAGVLVNFPRIFDNALTHASRPQQDVILQDGSGPRSNNGSLIMAIFLLIVALAVFQSVHGSPFSERIGIALLMFAGLLCLRGLRA